MGFGSRALVIVEGEFGSSEERDMLSQDLGKVISRTLSSLIFVWYILYLAYTIIFVVRVRSWDDTIKGQCYYTRGLFSSNGGTTTL